MRLDTNVTAKKRPRYTLLDDPGSAAGNEIIVTIFDWQGKAPIRATLGWMAHSREGAHVGPDESEEVTVPFNDWHAFRDEARLKALKNEKYTIDGKLIK